ncbi:MAG: hypothetical protein ABT10_26305 [Novosphingobium sp. SCN 63-17]|nr:MAG: hypothetical protein ABT10_26305 [Novosphingobium sp. SCN 63-17]OJX97628.1 MAG: hypothetical protein BGP00_04905 [Novosphingobium sp. 63-713]
MLRPFDEGAGAPQQPGRLIAESSGLSGGLLVERVFGIKTLQRMIDMHGRQQVPGLREPSLHLDQGCLDCLILGGFKRV